MIENKQLYPFEETNESNEPPKVETEPEISLWQSAAKSLERVAVSVFCLLLLILVAKNPHPLAKWVKQHLHTAMNLSAGQTFGRFLKSPVVKSIVANGRNLIRLEDVTKKGRINLPQENARFGDHPVWPLQGKILRRFGWYQSLASDKPQFSRGVVISGAPDTAVFAVQSGTVAEVYREQVGWTLVLDHGSHCRSVYRNLGQVLVNLGQNLQAGEAIAKLKTWVPTGQPSLEFELQEAGEPVDPLSVFTEI